MVFDVATVHEAKPDSTQFIIVGGFTPANSSHLHLQNLSLKEIILRAYAINELRIKWPRDLPPTLLQTRYVVEAKSDPETDGRLARLSPEQIEFEQEHMLQAMLAERFNLKAHWETREEKTYDLVVVKAGRLKPATGAPPTKEELKFWGDKPIPPLYSKYNDTGGVEHIAHAASITQIVTMLAAEFRHPITDKTGLTGAFDFDLKSYQTYTAQRKDDETNPWPTLAQAIQEQIGLKIIPARGPVPMLLVEALHGPSDN